MDIKLFFFFDTFFPWGISIVFVRYLGSFYTYRFYQYLMCRIWDRKPEDWSYGYPITSLYAFKYPFKQDPLLLKSCGVDRNILKYGTYNREPFQTFSNVDVRIVGDFSTRILFILALSIGSIGVLCVWMSKSWIFGSEVYLWLEPLLGTFCSIYLILSYIQIFIYLPLYEGKKGKRNLGRPNWKTNFSKTGDDPIYQPFYQLASRKALRNFLNLPNKFYQLAPSNKTFIGAFFFRNYGGIKFFILFVYNCVFWGALGFYFLNLFLLKGIKGFFYLLQGGCYLNERPEYYVAMHKSGLSAGIAATQDSKATQLIGSGVAEVSPVQMQLSCEVDLNAGFSVTRWVTSRVFDSDGGTSISEAYAFTVNTTFTSLTQSLYRVFSEGFYNILSFVDPIEEIGLYKLSTTRIPTIYNLLYNEITTWSFSSKGIYQGGSPTLGDSVLTIDWATPIFGWSQLIDSVLLWVLFFWIPIQYYKGIRLDRLFALNYYRDTFELNTNNSISFTLSAFRYGTSSRKFGATPEPNLVYSILVQRVIKIRIFFTNIINRISFDQPNPLVFSLYAFRKEFIRRSPIFSQGYELHEIRLNSKVDQKVNCFTQMAWPNSTGLVMFPVLLVYFIMWLEPNEEDLIL
jgi:hypothetical protein